MLNYYRIRNYLLGIFLTLIKRWTDLQVLIGRQSIKDGQHGLFRYKGLLCTNIIHSQTDLQAIEEFDDFREDDVLVLTYPKAGTHFLAGVINSIYYEEGLINKKRDHFFSLQMLEISGPRKNSPKEPLKHVTTSPSPRVLGTHMPWSYLPPKVKDHKVKVIHCLRNPKDVACSAFPFFKTVNMLSSAAKWSDFVYNFVNDKVVGGDFFEFLRQWYPNRNSPNNMYVYYEDMIEDLEGSVRRVAEFLGVKLTDEQVNRVVEENTFKNLTKQIGNTPMHRQGKSGRWRSNFTVEQNEMADEWIKNGMKDLPDLSFKY